MPDAPQQEQITFPLQLALVSPQFSWGPLVIGGETIQGVLLVTLHHPAGPITSIITHAHALEMASGIFEHATQVERNSDYPVSEH
jgi:hypothetical protein